MTNSVHWKLKKNEYSIYQAIKKKEEQNKTYKKKKTNGFILCPSITPKHVSICINYNKTKITHTV